MDARAGVRGLVLPALVAGLLTGACSPPPEGSRPRKLTLYCSVHSDWCEAVKGAFETDTGIQVSMIRKSSGEMYAQVAAERRNPRGDVWYGGTGDAHAQAAEVGLTEPYRSSRLEELHAWAVDPAGKGEHRMNGLYMGILGFGYNREWLAERGIAPPAGWRDLADSRFRGEVQMANPNTSGTAYTALATLVQLMGEEEAFVYLRALHANVSQYTRSGSAPVRAAARGEAGVGIVFLHDAVTQIVAGFPIETVIPAEGTGFEIGGLSMIHGARHPEAARRFVDWALGERAQRLAVTAHAFQIPSNRATPIPPGTPSAAPGQLIDFDFEHFGSKAVRSALLDRWDQEVKRAPR